MRAKRPEFFLGIFLAVLLIAGMTAQEKGKAQKAEKELMIVKMVLAERMKAEEHVDKIKSLAEKIVDMNCKIRTHFNQGQKDDFKAIADLFGENAVITTPDYRRIQGKRNIFKLWGEARSKALRIAEERQGKVSLEIKIERIFLTDAIGKKEVEIKGEKVTYDCMAYVMGEIRIVVSERGEKIQNDTYSMTLLLLHRTDCPWEP